MPDSRTHRGAHPEDARDFAPAVAPVLREAVCELSFLLGRDYAPDASLKLVGDHHQLSARQRSAVQRGTCSDEARARRRARRIRPSELRAHALAVDGFNVLITVEAMLSHAPLFRGRDGALRDLASVHGTYRAVAETERAATLIADLLAQHAPAHVLILLDRPVGNSGRTRALLASACAQVPLLAEVKLSDRVDDELVESGRVIASSDAGVIGRARAWIDLPAALASEHGPCWLLSLADEERA